MTPAPTPPRLPDELERKAWRLHQDTCVDGDDVCRRKCRAYRNLVEAIQLGLTAGRAQGLEEAAAIALSHRHTRSGWVKDIGKVDDIAAEIRARAAQVKP